MSDTTADVTASGEKYYIVIGERELKEFKEDGIDKLPENIKKIKSIMMYEYTKMDYVEISKEVYNKFGLENYIDFNAYDKYYNSYAEKSKTENNPYDTTNTFIVFLIKKEDKTEIKFKEFNTDPLENIKNTYSLNELKLTPGNIADLNKTYYEPFNKTDLNNKGGKSHHNTTKKNHAHKASGKS